MTSLPEQLSAARNAQLDTQFRVFHNVTSQAFDNASRLWSLNLSVSRDSVERSSRTVRQLIGAPDARGLDVLRTHSEEQMRSLFAYGRALFDLASGGQAGLHALRTLAPAPALGAPAAAPAAAFVIDAGNEAARGALDTAAGVAERAAEATTDAGAPTVADATGAAGERASEVWHSAANVADSRVAEPVVVLQEETPPPAGAIDGGIDQVLDAPAPAAKPKPLAKVAAKGVPKAAVAPHPMAAPVEDTDTSAVVRIETPPPKRRK